MLGCARPPAAQRHGDGPGKLLGAGYGGEELSVEWMPVVEGDLSDVWLLFKPRDAWSLDKIISRSAGAKAVSG